VDWAWGYASWPVWAVLAVGTVTFWAVTFLAVRELLVGRYPTDSSDRGDADPPHERLARGEITLDEYLRLSAESTSGAKPEHSPTAHP
jgi:uncharacterized membrane protein